MSLLVSARRLIETASLRDGVINLASACEAASDIYFDRKRKSAAPRVVAILDGSGSFASKRYDRITRHVDRRSLKTEEAPMFDLVEKAYQTRNKLVHEGKLGYTRGRAFVPVERQDVNRFWEACVRAIDWISQL